MRQINEEQNNAVVYFAEQRLSLKCHLFIIGESYENVWRANLSVTSQRSLATKVGVKYCSNKSFVTKAMMAASNSTNKMTSPLRKVN